MFFPIKNFFSSRNAHERGDIQQYSTTVEIELKALRGKKFSTVVHFVHL